MPKEVILFLPGYGVLLLAAVALSLWPPQKPNPWFGYRTPASMRNEENWRIAQRYSAMVMGLCTVIGLAVLLVISNMDVSSNTYVAFGVGGLLLSVALTIILTELRIARPHNRRS